jgi:N-acetylneuraminate synthase
MSAWAELDATVRRLSEAAIPFLLMQCTSAYPCPPERVGLNVLAEMKARFQCEVGLSDHSGTIWPGIASIMAGGKVIEVHVTWDRTMFGPDTIASVTFAELKQMVEGIRFTEKMLNNPVDKEAEAAGLDRMRKMFGQSLVAASELPAGTVLRAEHIATRKPLAGIPASDFSSVLGAKIRRKISAGEFLQSADIEK